MILYLICDMRRGVLYQDLSLELLKEFRKSIAQFAVLTNEWNPLLSAALVKEDGFYVCLPLNHHPCSVLLEILESLSTNRMPMVTEENMDPAISCLSQVVQHIEAQHSTTNQVIMTRVIVISMSTYLYVPYEATLQQLTVKLLEHNAFLDFLHIIDSNDISSTFSCQADVQQLASALEGLENFSLKASISQESPFRKYLNELASQLWIFPVTIRINETQGLTCQGKPVAMLCRSKVIKQNIQKLQQNGGVLIETVGIIKINNQCGLSQTLLYGIPIYLTESENIFITNSMEMTFHQLTTVLKEQEVFLLRTSHDLLDFSQLPSSIYHYCIGSLPESFRTSSGKFQRPICLQGLLPGELLTFPGLLPLEEDLKTLNSNASHQIQTIDEFNPLEYSSHEIEFLISNRKKSFQKSSNFTSMPKAKAKYNSTRVKTNSACAKTNFDHAKTKMVSSKNCSHGKGLSAKRLYLDTQHTDIKIPASYKIPTAAQLLEDHDTTTSNLLSKDLWCSIDKKTLSTDILNLSKNESKKIGNSVNPKK